MAPNGPVAKMLASHSVAMKVGTCTVKGASGVGCVLATIDADARFSPVPRNLAMSWEILTCLYELIGCALAATATIVSRCLLTLSLRASVCWVLLALWGTLVDRGLTVSLGPSSHSWCASL